MFHPLGYRELAAIYNTILDELNAQYVLGYVSDNPERDGKFRRLKVEMRPDHLRPRHRLGYNAPEDPEPES